VTSKDLSEGSHYAIEKFGRNDVSLNSDVLWQQHRDLAAEKL